MTRRESIAIPPFRIDLAAEQLWRGDEALPLRPKTWAVLRYLVEHPGILATKDDLLDAVWGDTAVSEGTLNKSIGELRVALGDDAQAPRFIQTVTRRGFRWIAPTPPACAVVASAEPRAPSPQEGIRGQQRAEADRLAPVVPFVGRGQEAAFLEERMARAASGERQLVFVTGEPGIGKTTLVERFLRSLTGEEWPLPAVIVRGQCIEAYGQHEPYLPLLEALERLARGPLGSRLDGVLQRCAPTWRAQLATLGGSDGGAAARDGTPGRMLRELAMALEELTSETPLVLVVEDLQWADHATTDAINVLAQRREPARLMLLGTVRAADLMVSEHPLLGVKTELVRKRLAREVVMGPLAAPEIAELLSMRFGGARFPELAEWLRKQTDGNPFFVQAVVDDLLARGQLVEVDGAWQVRTSEQEIRRGVPDSLREIIERRLGRLTSEVVALLEAASVDGSEFSAHGVAATCERGAEAIEVAFAELVQRDEIVRSVGEVSWPDGSAGTKFGFVHALYQRVLYDRVPLIRRRRLHQQIGERIERGYAAAGDGPLEVASRLAQHFELSGDSARAIRYRRQSAAIAQSRHAQREAIEHLHRALETLRVTPASPARDLEELGILAALLAPLYATAGAGSAELVEVAGRVHALTDRGETTIELLQALGNLMGFHATRGQLGEAQRICEQSIERASEVEWGGLFVSISSGQLGLCRMLRGEMKDAIEPLERPLDLPMLVPLAPMEPSVAAAGDLGQTLCVLGEIEAGLARVRGAYERAEAAQYAPTLIYAAADRMRTAALLGDVADTHRTALRIAEVAERQEIERWAGVARIGLGWAACLGGDTAGVEKIGDGRRVLYDFGNRVYQPFYAAMQASALLALGRPQDAEDVLRAALAEVEETDERWCEADLHRLLGEAVAADDSRRNDAVRCFRRAAEVAGAQSARWWELRALRSWVRLSPNDSEARARLSAVCAPFDDRVDLPDLREARELLG